MPAISQQNLIDAATDAATLAAVVNSPPTTMITSRLGQPLLPLSAWQAASAAQAGTLVHIATTAFNMAAATSYGITTSGSNLAPLLPQLSSVAFGVKISVTDLDYLAATNNQVFHAYAGDNIVFQDAAPAGTFALTLNGVTITFVSNGSYWRVFYYGS